MAKPKIFCPLPWSSITVQPFGTTLCCNSSADLRNGKQSPVEVFSGDRYRKVRRQLIDGEWPEECSLCQSHEAQGLRSHRQASLLQAEFRGLNELSDFGEGPGKIAHLEISSDNRCNLKCRMCSPAFSTRWNEDLPALAEIPGSVPEHYFDPIVPQDADLAAFLPHMNSVRALVIKGGEPMINPELTSFLRVLDARGLAGEIYLRIVSNGTAVRSDYLKLLKRFKACDVVISVDGVDPWFAYIRNGKFVFSDITAGLDRIASAGISYAVTTAFQTYNMLSYDRLLRALRPWTCNYLVSLVTSHALNPLLVPDPLREESARRIEAVLAESEWPARTAAEVGRLVALLREGRFDPANWRTFWKYTDSLDQVRGQNLADVDPELAAFRGYSARASSQFLHQD